KMAAPGPQQLQQQQQQMLQQQQAAADRQSQGQREREALERTARSIFVGNIPYEASEDRLKEMFEQAGPVIGFRLVYDRETGKPKGYGFCEYKDLPTAQAALRNLQNIEFCGRPLRIGPAAGEQNQQQQQQQQDGQSHGSGVSGPPVDSPYGEKVDPKNAPEEISRAVASLPPEQMFELMRQMKQCIQNNPHEARNMLLQNPQLAYALLQAQIVMKLVDPKVAIAMLSRTTEQIPPVMPVDQPMQQQQQHYQHQPPQPPQPPMQQQMYHHHQPPPPPPPQHQQQIYPQQQQPYRQPPPPPPPQAQPQQPQQPQSSQGGGAQLSMGAIAGGDQEKAALIMQVLQLSDEQIHMLPEDQRRSIMILKEQLAKAGHI
ncbi:hypothetical protein BOX15_Mlig006421g1, partial [Macrostomum lignano]